MITTMNSTTDFDFLTNVISTAAPPEEKTEFARMTMNRISGLVPYRNSWKGFVLDG